MKKLSFFIVGLLVISSFAALSINVEASERQATIQMSFLKPNLVEKEGFIELEIKSANNHIFNTGQPMLPIQTETIYLPFGSEIIDVTCEIGTIKTMTLENKIIPAPEPIREDLVIATNNKEMNNEIYNSDDMFPVSWFSYDVGVGLDKNMNHKTIVTLHGYPARYNPTSDILEYTDTINIDVTYTEGNNPFPTYTEYDMVIIAPESFSQDLQPLINHKNSYGVETILKTTEDIFSEYTGIDEPEKIKYFIKDALEEWGVKYVCLVGGLKSLIYAKPRDDANQGSSKWWYVPVRYSNLYEGEPGYCCDLYYADIYKEGGEFDNWDSNDDGIFAEWSGARRDQLDLFPDVALGRLACRNTNEVKIIVDKIITYETSADPSWFEKIIAVSGDGFLDQYDLDIQWDTNDLPNGEYTIYAQSENPEGTKGPIDEIPITIDRTKDTKITFNHDDHLTTGLKYPFDPVAEIVSISDGDILGNTDYSYTPKGSEAYLNSEFHWADIDFLDGVLYIRGKTYDPKPYGYTTDIKVWIENSNGERIFEDERLNSLTYFEGEWTTGEQLLHERGGGLYYMPENFEKELLWTSNGKWTDQSQVISAFSNGAGFVFFSGHGSPGWWGNHFPGIPGNRHLGETEGLLVFDWNGPPYLPMDQLTNDYKTPVVVVGGCHNSDFNVSLIPTFIDKTNELWTHSYGRPTAECWSWYLTSLSKRGAIACMGNTGYGYGIPGEDCTIGGVDNWITTEFFKKYGTEGFDILGEAYAQTLTSYINVFRTQGVPGYPWDSGHEKTVQQWVLHGDPSLKLGGYPASVGVNVITSGSTSYTDGYPGEQINLIASANGQPITCTWDLDSDGEFDDAIGSSIKENWASPGVYWVSIKTTYNGQQIIRNTIVDIQKDQAPEKPEKPSGPSKIKTNKEITFTTSAQDPYNDELTYLFDWGDGEYSIIGPIKSGETATASHKWISNGNYKIKVQAFDNFGQWSDWSEPTSIMLSKSKLVSKTTIQLFIEKLIERYPNSFPLIKEILAL